MEVASKRPLQRSCFKEVPSKRVLSLKRSLNPTFNPTIDSESELLLKTSDLEIM